MSKNVQLYIEKGLISRSDVDFLGDLDPSRTKKYLNFIIKSYLADVNLDLLRNRISEYDTLLNRNMATRKDINSFKTFGQFDEYVQKLNNVKSNRGIKREAKKDANIILDNDDIFIVSPLSHEASQIYGSGTKWCTTAENSVHWERYSYGHFVTFYYIQIRSDSLKKCLQENLWKIAVAVYPNGKMEAYNAADHRIGYQGPGEANLQLTKLFKSLSIDRSLFLPISMDDRLVDILSYKHQQDVTDLNLLKMGLTKIPDSIGEMTQLKLLDLSENKLQTIPESIGKLLNLKTLYLFHNELTSLPESLGNLIGLEWLGLRGNTISKRTIRELKRKLSTTWIYEN